MKLLGRNLSRRDLIPVGAALLLPVPLVALNGYAAGLPDAVGRGLGSVVTLDAKDGRNGVEASGRAAETGSAHAAFRTWDAESHPEPWHGSRGARSRAEWIGRHADGSRRERKGTGPNAQRWRSW